MSNQTTPRSSLEVSPELARASPETPYQIRSSAGIQSLGLASSAASGGKLPGPADDMPDTFPSKPTELDVTHAEPRLALDVRRLGLDAILFDLDGVVTQTASLHARVWRRLFDEFLARRAAGGNHTPFRMPEDYLAHVDGKLRIEGVRSFLRSRDIELPFGSLSDSPDSETVCGLGNRKTRLFIQVLDSHGADVFDGTLTFLRAVRAAALKTACVSSSLTCRKVLEKTQLTDQFDAVYDGSDLEREGRDGKPAPDGFLRGAELIGVDPGRAAVVEDAVVGVAAGRAGGFRLVIGVDRGVGQQALLDAGADIVVSDLAELMTA